jgi:hypothetical protein
MAIKVVFCDDEWDSGIQYRSQRRVGSPMSPSFVPGNLSRRLGEVFGGMVKIESMELDVRTQVRLNDQQCCVAMGPNALQRLTHLSVDCSPSLAEMLIRTCRPHRLRSLETLSPTDDSEKLDIYAVICECQNAPTSEWRRHRPWIVFSTLES